MNGPDSEPLGPAAEVNGVRQDCDCGVWDNALLHALEHVNRENYCAYELFALGADWGVAWLSAIIGMAEAIRRTHLGIRPVVRVQSKPGPIELPPLCNVCGWGEFSTIRCRADMRLAIVCDGCGSEKPTQHKTEGT
jgi:hypothetical protein